MWVIEGSTTFAPKSPCDKLARSRRCARVWLWEMTNWYVILVHSHESSRIESVRSTEGTFGKSVPFQFEEELAFGHQRPTMWLWGEIQDTKSKRTMHFGWGFVTQEPPTLTRANVCSPLRLLDIVGKKYWLVFAWTKHYRLFQPESSTK